MISTLIQFIEAIRSQVNKGIYVWGGNGEDLTAMNDPIAWIERREEDPENEKRDIALFEKRKKDGVNPIQAFDCSGLVYWALHTLGLQKTDLSSRGFYSLCRHIEEKDLRVGDLVFHHDGKQIVHVGVCVGEEQIDEIDADDEDEREEPVEDLLGALVCRTALLDIGTLLLRIPVRGKGVGIDIRLAESAVDDVVRHSQRSGGKQIEDRAEHPFQPQKQLIHSEKKNEIQRQKKKRAQFAFVFQDEVSFPKKGSVL